MGLPLNKKNTLRAIIGTMVSEKWDDIMSGPEQEPDTDLLLLDL